MWYDIGIKTTIKFEVNVLKLQEGALARKFQSSNPHKFFQSVFAKF